MGRFRRRRHRSNLCARCQAELAEEQRSADATKLHASGTLTAAEVEIDAPDAAGLSRALDAMTALGARTDGNRAFLGGAAAVRFWTVDLVNLAESFDVYAQDGVVDEGVVSEGAAVHVLVTGGSELLGAQAGLTACGLEVDQDDLREAISQGRDVVRLEDGTWARLTSEEAARSLVNGDLARASGKGMKLSHRDVEQLEGVLRGLGRVKMVPGSEQLFQSLLIGSGNIIPKRLQATLRSYQEVGLAWLRFIHDLGSGGILADRMGAGKTISAIALLCSVQEDEGHIKALVVAPTSVVPNWLREFSKFAPHIKALRWDGPKRMDKLAHAATQAEVIVTSYTLAKNDFDFLNSLSLDYVILDEAQAIKTPSNATSKAMRNYTALHRLAITGTPIENRLSEFWSLFDFTSPGLLGSLSQFKANSNLIGQGDKAAVARLRQQIGPFLLRRDTRDVLKDLPSCIEQDYLCPMTERQASLYQDLKDQAKLRAQEEGTSRMIMLQVITRLRQAACDPRLTGTSAYKEEDSGKLLALRDLLEECIDGGHRTIVFSQYTEMLSLIKDMLNKSKIKFEYLDGSTKDRMGAVDRFQADDSIPVFLISLKAGGTGLNITAADTVIHYDPWWNPAVEDQATARAHRMGQTKTVTVYRLIAEGTIEEKVSDLKARKAKLAADVLADSDSVERSVTLEDMRGLIS